VAFIINPDGAPPPKHVLNSQDGTATIYSLNNHYRRELLFARRDQINNGIRRRLSNTHLNSNKCELTGEHAILILHPN
jgi:hypothetical protein